MTSWKRRYRTGSDKPGWLWTWQLANRTMMGRWLMERSMMLNREEVIRPQTRMRSKLLREKIVERIQWEQLSLRMRVKLQLPKIIRLLQLLQSRVQIRPLQLSLESKLIARSQHLLKDREQAPRISQQPPRRAPSRQRPGAALLSQRPAALGPAGRLVETLL